jgi:hypothetical protein
MYARLLPIVLFVCLFLGSCGVYSLTGASIEGKTINIHTIENKARNIAPTLSPTLTTKIRSRIISQTGLGPVNTDAADYDISGTITSYEVTVSGVQNTQTASQNRLTITIQIKFQNRLDPKADFDQAFTRFADFPASQTLQAAEGRMIEDIGTQLADDIFNKAFVNW